MSEHLTTLFDYNVEFSADSIEWCPHDPFKEHFVCANYCLKEDDARRAIQVRLGRVLLFKMAPKVGVTLLHMVHTVGVLDQKWCPNKIDNNIILGVVNSERTLEIYKLNEGGNDLIMLAHHRVVSDESSCLIMALDWSNGKYESDQPDILCGDSNGFVHLLNFDGRNITKLSSVKPHNFQFWTGAFYYWDPNIYFSGGDDSVLNKFDKRVGTNPVHVNRVHKSGVTCMHSNKAEEFLLATGSYDTFMHLWDIRNMKTPTRSLEFMGTLWRLKWNPSKPTEILVAGMSAGAFVAENKTDELCITKSYFEHTSLVYGVDWCLLEEADIKKYHEDARGLIATCSFYDHSLCISYI